MTIEPTGSEDKTIFDGYEAQSRLECGSRTKVCHVESAAYHTLQAQ